MSRNQHDRLLDHKNFDLDTNILTSSAVGALPAGSTLHDVLTGSSSEVLMQDGVTSPPIALETEAGDDWLYQG